MPECPDRNRIIAEGRESAVKFADQVKRLAECTGKQGGFVEQFRVTELARLQCDDARLVLEHHRSDHGC
jgi:hypothetical protein